MTVKPDNPVISVDASMLEQLPDDVREVLELFYDKRQRDETRILNGIQRDYQTEQAKALLDLDAGWAEVGQEESLDSVQGEWLSEVMADCPDYDDFGNEIPPRPYRRESPPTIHQFYRDLYGILGVDDYYKSESDRECSILVNHRDREHPYQLYGDYWDFIEGVRPETSFIYMGSFWQPPSGFLIAKRNAMKTIGGFCVDIDRFEDEKGMYFQASWVMQTLGKVFAETPEIEPNYLMLSGTGVQLWYVFGEQIPLLSARKSPRRKKYGEVLKLLYQWFDDRLPRNRFKVDVPCATISHAFRAPGSPAKHHYPTRLFVKNGADRPLVSPLELSRFLGGPLMPYDLEDWDQEAYERLKEDAQRANWREQPATPKQLAYLDKLEKWHCVEEVPDGLTQGDADQLIKQAELVVTRRVQFKQTEGGCIKTSEGHLVRRKPRDPKLYDHTLGRMKVETPAGSRYNAMFGLAGLAWNCAVPRSQVQNDLTALLDTEWARKLGHDGKPLGKKDVRDAMKGYHPLGALRTTEQLESRMQWKFNPPAKRNGRKQSEHLALVARPIKEALKASGVMKPEGRPKGSGTKEAEIKAYAAEHPEANHSEIARALGVSRPTVIKWLKPKGVSN